jgi:hypothetical protein
LRFTTNAYPKEQRRDAWRFALKRLSLTLDEADETSLYGELIQFRSSTGIDFIRVTGTPQSWSVDFREQPGSYHARYATDTDAGGWRDDLRPG